jgi:septal ring factor EnvC (AmiA/AmiB activator)
MTKLFDEEGNPVEVLDEEAIKALEERAAKAEELEAAVKERDEKLSKLEQKDFNWRKLETATEEEKAKMMEGFSAEKQELIQQEAERRKEISDIKQSINSEREEAILAMIAGEDEELRNQIKETASTFIGEARTTKELADRYSNAYTLIKGAKPQVNPLNAFYPVSSPKEGTSGNKFGDTDEGKANIKKWFGIDV